MPRTEIGRANHVLHKTCRSKTDNRHMSNPSNQFAGLRQQVLLIERAAMPVYPGDRTVDAGRDAQTTALINDGRAERIVTETPHILQHAN
eukprot:5647949-Lingulodinium_polyedra.AAC.1